MKRRGLWVLLTLTLGSRGALAGELTQRLQELLAADPRWEVLAVDDQRPAVGPVTAATPAGVAAAFGCQAIQVEGLWLITRAPALDETLATWLRSPAVAALGEPLRSLRDLPAAELPAAVAARYWAATEQVRTQALATAAAWQAARPAAARGLQVLDQRPGPELQQVRQFLQLQALQDLLRSWRSQLDYRLSAIQRSPGGQVSVVWVAAGGGAGRASYGVGSAGQSPAQSGPWYSWQHAQSAGEWARAVTWRAAGPVDTALATAPDPLPPLALGGAGELLVAVRQRPAWQVWQGLGAVLGVKLATPADRPRAATDLAAAWYAALPLAERLAARGYGPLGGPGERLWPLLTAAEQTAADGPNGLPAAQLSPAVQALCAAIRDRYQAGSNEDAVTGLQALQAADWTARVICWADGSALFSQVAGRHARVWSLSLTQPPAEVDKLLQPLTSGPSGLRRTPHGVRQTEPECPSRYANLKPPTLVGETAPDR
ncbi:MAG: hypothetical protein IT204_25300 [Fimbriimonadaceae bacterium]|nr:hypothetical protein [Fimbriimonadaceae bacterium]